jgi:DNA-binding MarR family transcriptional regulator
VHLTADGEALFDRLRVVAQTFDAVLRSDLTDQETATLITLLGRVERNLPLD